MYWWHLVNLSEDKMLYKFYQAQRNNPVKDDWTTQIDKDKEELNINLSDSDIKEMSKFNFKKLIKEKIKISTMDHLNQLKESHSKIKNIEYPDLKCSDYLVNKIISTKEAKMLFKFRTRMYSVKANFRSKYENNMLCDLCLTSDCSQSHLFICPVIKAFVPELVDTPVKYEHIFGSTNQMKEAVKLLEKICEIREQLIEDIQ